MPPAPRGDGAPFPLPGAGSAEGGSPRWQAVEAALAPEGAGVTAAVEAALDAGPATVRGVARILEEAAPGILSHREGYLHPVLAQLRREGRIEGRWLPLPDGRGRRVWSAAGAPAGRPPYAPGVALSPAWQPSLDGPARDASRGLPGSLEREETRIEIRGHLEDLLSDFLRTGMDRRAALHGAVEELGDPWRIRTDLRSVLRGRRVVVFPWSSAERLLHVVHQEILPIAVALLLVLLVRWKVVQAYNIPSGSMEPTLHGSEVDPDYILVNKLAYFASDPRRWDVVVFYPPTEKDAADPTAFVKRCVGESGETIDFRGGDVYVDGALARRDEHVEDAMLVPAYDLADDLAEPPAPPPRRRRAFVRPLFLAPPVPGDDHPEAPPPPPDPAERQRRAWVRVFEDSWREREGAWRLEGDGLHALPPPGGEARLEYRRDITNSYRDGSGSLRNHYTSVGDLEVRFEVVAGEGATVGAVLSEGGDRHHLELGPDGLRLRAEGVPAVHVPGVRLVAGRSVEVRLRNVDDRVTVWIDGGLVARETLPPRATVPEDPERGGVVLHTRGAAARFSGVRIRRDIVQLRAGSPAAWPVRVPEGHLFMVGDNSASSNDSRMWGPVDARDVIGSPVAVIYPPSRARPVR